MFNPLYEEKPHLEFSDGFIKTFYSKGHSKSKGINFKIKAPLSWANEEGERPNIITKFISENGNGFEMVTITIKNMSMLFDKELANQVIDEVVRTKSYDDFTLPSSTLIEAKKVMFEGWSGLSLRSKIKRQRVDLVINQEALTYCIIYKDKLILINFSVGNLSIAQEDLEKRFEKFKPLFFKIANSFVIENEYK